MKEEEPGILNVNLITWKDSDQIRTWSFFKKNGLQKKKCLLFISFSLLQLFLLICNSCSLFSVGFLASKLTPCLPYFMTQPVPIILSFSTLIICPVNSTGCLEIQHHSSRSFSLSQLFQSLMPLQIHWIWIPRIPFTKGYGW